MLQLRNLRKRFHQLEVLKGLSITASGEDFVILMGPNGAGKSTLFDIISGKISPDSGEIWLDGVEISALSESERAPLVGRLFQNTYLGCCANLTIRENLALASLKGRRASLKGGLGSFPEERAIEMLKPLGLNLENQLDLPVGNLSGGQRQMLSFIMAPLHPPRLLLLDEPTAALDPRSATQLLLLTKRYANQHKIPVIMITHDPMVAKNLGNRLWVVQNGGIARNLGQEKNEMEPDQFFHSIDYGRLLT